MFILLAMLVPSLIKICHLHNIIPAVSKSCFHDIRDLRRIRNTINQTTVCTIPASLIHSKIDYCNSLLLNLPATQTNRLQLVLNSAARAVTNTHKFHHITPILKYLHWLEINERIKYKVLSHIYHFLHIVLLGLLHITLCRRSLASRLKLQIDLSTIPLLFCGTVSNVIYHVAHHITSLY